MFRTVASLLTLVCCASAHAATWYGFNIGTTQTLAFFDYDTITRHGREITLWVKFYSNQDEQRLEGVESSAMKVTYSCLNRTSQILSSTSYDKNGKVLHSESSKRGIEDVVPGTIGEQLLGAVCSKNFQKVNSSPLYFPIKNNDINEYVQNYFADQKFAKVDPLPQKAIWYFFADATSDTHVAFFDFNSIDKNSERVTLWERFVKDDSLPDTDGTSSFAMKVTYFCKKMTIQPMVYSTYNMERTFYGAFKANEQPKPVAEGSVASSILKKVCGDNFPGEVTDLSYFPIGDKDIYEFSKSFFEEIRATSKAQTPISK